MAVKKQRRAKIREEKLAEKRRAKHHAKQELQNILRQKHYDKIEHIEKVKKKI